MDYLWDTFNRTVVDSWGSTEGPVYYTEGVSIPATLAWTLGGTAANFDVAADVGTIANGSGGATNTAKAVGVGKADVDMTMEFQWSANPVTAASFDQVMLCCRVSGSAGAFTAYYAARVRIPDLAAPTPGRPFLSIVKTGTVLAGGGAETGAPAVDGKLTWWKLRFKVKQNGAGVDLYAALWRRDTETEAQATTRTITAGDAVAALVAGDVGVRHVNTGTGAAITLTVDSIRVARYPAEDANHKKGIAVRMSPATNPPPNQTNSPGSSARRPGRSKYQRTTDLTPAVPAAWWNPIWRSPGPIISLAYNWRSFYNDHTTLGALTDGNVGWAADNVNVVDIIESCIDAYANGYRLGLKVYCQAETANRAEGSYPGWLKTLSSTAFTNPTETLSAPTFINVLGGETGFYVHNWWYNQTVRRCIHRDMLRLRRLLDTNGGAPMGGNTYGSVMRYVQWSVPYRGIEEMIAKDNAGAPGDSLRNVVSAFKDPNPTSPAAAEWIIQTTPVHGFPDGSPITVTGGTGTGAPGTTIANLNGTYTVSNSYGNGTAITSRSQLRLVGAVLGTGTAGYTADSADFFAYGSAADDENYNRNQLRTALGIATKTLAQEIADPSLITALNNVRRPAYLASWRELALDHMAVYSGAGYDTIIYPGEVWGPSGVAPNTSANGITSGYAQTYELVDRLVYDSRTCFGITNLQVVDNYALGTAGVDYFVFGNFAAPRPHGEYAHDSPNLNTVLAKAEARGFPSYLQTGGSNVFNNAPVNYPPPSDPRDAYHVTLHLDGFGYIEALVIEVATAQLTSAANAEDYQTIAESANFIVTVPQIIVGSEPVATGAPSVGSTLTCSTGSWTNTPNPALYAYQWQQATTVGGTYGNIAGATANTFLLTAGQTGLFVRCRVKATNGEGISSDVFSNSLGAVTAAGGVPVPTIDPAITPSASDRIIGTVLTCDDGTWSNSPTLIAKKWQRAPQGTTGWADIAGATGNTYTLAYVSESNTDERKDIRCLVTASNASGSATQPSNSVLSVNPSAVPANTVAPIADGDLFQGNSLNVIHNGTWTHSPVGQTYLWQRSPTGVGSWTSTGGMGASYATVSADIGQYLRVLVTAANEAGAGSAAASNVLGPIAVIAASIEGSTTVNAVVNRILPVAASIVGSTVVAGDITHFKQIAATISGNTTVTGTISMVRSIQAAIVGYTAVQAAVMRIRNIVRRHGKLGCGVYDVVVKERGGLDVTVAEVPWQTLSWSRVVDETSSAEVNARGGFGVECCDVLKDVRPWQHELAIYRDGAEVWAGPVFQVRFRPEEVVLSARDLSAWWDHRFIHNDVVYAIAADLAFIFQALIDDAMAPDTTPRIVTGVAPAGTKSTIEVLASQHRRLAELLRDLADTAVDWTAVGRKILIGGPTVPTAALGTFWDEHFLEPPEVVFDGGSQTNKWVVSGSGVGEAGDDVFAVAQDAHAIAAAGLLEDNDFVGTLDDFTSARAAAMSRLELTKEPVYVQQARLDAESPFRIDSLVAGARCELRLSDTCAPVSGHYRLSSVNVTAEATEEGGDEAVVLNFEPMGVA